MSNPVAESAVSFRAALVALGARCAADAAGVDISHSTNRHGEHSSYFRCEGRTVRVSDHDANQDFRFNEVTVLADHATAAYAQELLARWRAADAATAAEHARRIAERDAFEAPFIAEFRATAKSHEQEAILRRAYPDLFRPGVGTQQRQPVLARFRGKSF